MHLVVGENGEEPIITLGEKGAYLYGHGLVEPFSVGPVLETTGAGDAFNGGFATALSEGVTALEAVTVGCATAGISVTRAERHYLCPLAHKWRTYQKITVSIVLVNE